METPTVFITDRINFKFALSSRLDGKLDDRIHNVLIMYHTYSIDEHNYITVKGVKPMNIDFIISLVNGIDNDL